MAYDTPVFLQGPSVKTIADTFKALDREREQPKAAPPPGRGMKYDTGKPRWSLLMRGMARPLLRVAEILTFGAEKYADDSWQTVPDGITRYRDALYRHLHEVEMNGVLAKDPESGRLHLAHVACNALFVLWLAEEQ